MKTLNKDELERKLKKSGKKKTYQQPKVVYREPLEVSAALCSPGKTITPCSPINS
jgi:hypothetical protein